MTDKEIVERYKIGMKILNKRLQIQKKQATTKHNIGVYNGMMFAKSVFDSTEPKYIEPLKDTNNDNDSINNDNKKD